MARRRNAVKTLQIIASLLSIIACAGILSSTDRCSSLNDSSSEDVDLHKDYVGWHLVSDISALKNGDHVILVGQDAQDNFSILNKDFAGTPAEYSYDYISKNGSFYANKSSMTVFTLESFALSLYLVLGYITDNALCQSLACRTSG